MPFEIRPYPTFSWSQSRDALFQECERKYYYNYYAAHNGWLDSATEQQRRAYRLKKLVNLHLVLGTIIHEMAHQVIAQVYSDSTYDHVAVWIQNVKNRLNQAYLESKQVDRWQRMPNKTMMLHEMYYEGQLPEKTVQLIRDKIEPCVSNFFQSATFSEVQNDRQLELMEAENMKTTPFEDDHLYVIPDLVYRRSDGVVVIVDWKTGKEYEQNEDQTLLYAMYACEHYQVPLGQIEIRLEYLLTGTYKTIIPDQTSIDRTRAWIRDSLTSMKNVLENVALNKPLAETMFTSTNDVFACKGCNFREICPDRL